jgi:hypothetical protein
MKKVFICLFVLIISGELIAQNSSPIYSFFVAGHAYGNPNNPHYGLHYPFVDYIPKINSYPNIELGFFTGDVVVSSTSDYWDAAIADINKLNQTTYIAAGNHDMSSEFTNRFGNYFSSFIQNNDLFIVLTPGLDSWNISGNQLEFLTNTIDNNYTSVNNIFILMHELIWWSPDNEYQNVKINYTPHYPGSTNFETLVKPLLLSYPNHFTIFAGDLGATTQVSAYMYHSFDNITLIGSGMGGGHQDNIVITEIYEDHIYYNLIAINGDDPKALGELTDYSILNVSEPNKSYEISIKPNPVISKLVIDIPIHEYSYSVINMKGVEIASGQKNNQIINVSQIPEGLYILRINTSKNTFISKFIKASN